MKPTTAYTVGGIVALVCVGLGVYYLIPIPNGTHILGSAVGAADVKHAIVFFALAVIALIGARFAANSAAK
jgi:hypothetical protein